MVFDPDRCTGCGTCEAVCAARDGSAPDASRIQILREETAGANFAVFCQHCLDPLCLPACPQHAISRGESGIVSIDSRLCAHCGLCIQACPEAAPQRGPDAKVLKCDLCGGHPECVEACPHKALSFSSGKALGWIKLLRWPVQVLSFLFFVIILIGTVCSVSVADLSFGCPFGLLQNIAASKVILLATVFAAIFLVFLTILTGRAACGWLCPFGFFLDLVGKIVPQRFQLPRFVRTRLAKYGVGAAALGVSGAVGYQAFCTVCPIGTICRSYGLQSVVGGAELAILPTVAAMEVSEKRSWCRYLCPVGALLALCAKIGLIKIVIGASRCKKFSCMRCASTCPMGIIPESDLREGISPKLDASECIMCLRCVDTCPHSAVKIRFRWQKGVPAERRAPCGASNGGGQCLR
ncbi:MAG: 4Fe-4S binding protein [Desulfobacteraceae bacterium]|nr:4Fe-4S binding protein [Desulfobacteraceae bacterium]